ncbi:MBL fold metallo-hydrolase [Vreelandella utahensis]|uniref:MBL fold metallo-hydrolase n=1 Tax=Vreelandella halophila TaxID=86177 RepID=UPI000986E512|nr:MBL fold metallo-hydrolase [Halomonas utahensis]
MVRKNGNLLGWGFLAVATLVLSSGLAMAEEQYAIEQVKDNVYRFSYEHYHSAFMVTEQGIVVTDPINEEAASWLKAELAERFDVPVRYMVYSHNHVDHVMGGEVFDSEDVTVVAHEYAAQDLEWTRAPTAMPELTFPDELTLNLGDSRVELTYYGPNNGRGSVSMRFMPANVMYVVDWVVLGRMMYRDLPGYDIHGVIASTRELLNERPFDRFLGGHGVMGTREDVEAYLAYTEVLYNAVRDGMLEGRSLETLKQEIRLPEYSHLSMYEAWLPLNITGVHRTLIDQSYMDRRPDVSE